jgi:rod shape-determining protein MreD
MNKVFGWILIFGLQVVVFNHLDFSSYVLPQVFIILLISLPLHTSKINQVLIGFGLGLLADLFLSTPGIHASACMTLILIRMWLLSRLDLKEQIANKLSFNAKTVGLPTFFYVTTVLVVIYHLYVFSLESIGAIYWVKMLLTTLISSALSLLIIGLIQYMSFRD